MSPNPIRRRLAIGFRNQEFHFERAYLEKGSANSLFINILSFRPFKATLVSAVNDFNQIAGFARLALDSNDRSDLFLFLANAFANFSSQKAQSCSVEPIEYFTKCEEECARKLKALTKTLIYQYVSHLCEHLFDEPSLSLTCSILQSLITCFEDSSCLPKIAAVINSMGACERMIQQCLI